MNAGGRPLLTVGIPTWNRSGFLRNMILSVCTQSERLGLTSDVEVVVSDNASSDDTERVVAELRAQTPVRIEYHRNESNLGLGRNVARTLELAHGRYWMLYGDDDLMPEGALPTVLDTLRRSSDVPAIIFTQAGKDGQQWDEFDAKRMTVDGVARDYFYYMGNAGVLALRTADAKRQLDLYGIDRFQTWWPTTHLGFLTMTASGTRQAALVTSVLSSRSPHHAANTVYTSWYVWETTLFSLYETAMDLRPMLGERFFRAACGHVFAPKRVLDIAKNMFLYTTIFDLPEDVRRTREATRRSLRQGSPRTILPLLLMWFVTALPRPVKRAVFSTAFYLRWGKDARVHLARWQELAAEHRERRRSGGGAESAEPRVYTPDDL